jgi:hypothetical protein
MRWAKIRYEVGENKVRANPSDRNKVVFSLELSTCNAQTLEIMKSCRKEAKISVSSRVEDDELVEEINLQKLSFVDDDPSTAAAGGDSNQDNTTLSTHQSTHQKTPNVLPHHHPHRHHHHHKNDQDDYHLFAGSPCSGY